MAAVTRPTLLLIHGCFSTSAAFNRLALLLEEAGYRTLRADFPSTDPIKPFEVTAQKDIDHVRSEYLLPLIERDQKNLIIVVHSYGGLIAGGAAVGLSKTDRVAAGLRGGVSGLVYIAGNIVPSGQSLVESCGGQWPAWLIKDKPRDGVAVIEPLMETLAHDADESLEPEIRADSTPQGYRCLDTPAPSPCWAEKGYTGKLAYVRTAEDRINPAFAQDMWINVSGVEWDVMTMHTSHVPMISQPKQLAEHILDFIAKFEA